LSIKNDPFCKLINIPFDSGLSAGRNIGVENVETEFVVLCDDDFVFTKDTKIENLISVVNSNLSDLCAGLILQDGINVKNWSGIIDIKKNGPLVSPFISKTPIIKEGISLYSTDITLNFFAAKTDWLLKNKWDNSIKICYEHIDFFLNLKKNTNFISPPNPFFLSQDGNK
jgi:glycosyltransferase involved in cell wall biosynthesis